MHSHTLPTHVESKPILSNAQRLALQDALTGKLISLSFGSGVDSTAMMVALHEANIRPDVITFADTGGEKPETLIHLDKMNVILAKWGWPHINVCKKIPLPSTGYIDLYGNCMSNETLPSLAFGMKSCSIKWKQSPQDQFLKGVTRGPNKCDPNPVWLQAQEQNVRIVKLIGYDCGKADLRRSKAPTPTDSEFDYIYPLQLIGWKRSDCVLAIAESLGAHMVPIKSACFFCPASKPWELFWLAAEHPELMDQALLLERNALTGRHSRFDSVEFGDTWENMVRNADRFPSSNTTVGLGRNFAWNQWAVVNKVVDHNFKVRRDQREVLLAMSDAMRGEDNAFDARSATGVSNEIITRIRLAKQPEFLFE